MNLAQTKLSVPPMRREHVGRPRLIAALNAGLDAKLTLISAPAGFGKTTMLSEWLGRVDRPFAWVSLDQDDNAWHRFVTSCLTSLQRLDSGFGAGLLGALETPPLPSLSGVQAALPEELAILHRPLVLVLDDFHILVNPQVHDLVMNLIENQPLQMHLVLAGRADPPWPLARLRAAGALIEMRFLARMIGAAKHGERRASLMLGKAGDEMPGRAGCVGIELRRTQSVDLVSDVSHEPGVEELASENPQALFAETSRTRDPPLYETYFTLLGTSFCDDAASG